ncbi:hypothetical protein ACJIZ3_012841 [Penstemon smallii]|uniref:Uncharacterized protein n=1 Tax=Penstemon smallii TaxID=265156 RepID=A0ABD3UN62_9LAMI
MAAEKVTIMVLKVDLQCPCCYKKLRVLVDSLLVLLSGSERVGEIRDQVYDEKGNTVTITVVCCSPEKIRDKLCCKGRKVIKSIEIKDPPKPKEPEKKKEPDKPKVVVIEKPKEPEMPKVVVVEKPKEPEKPKFEKPKEPENPKSNNPPPKPDPPKNPEPVQIPAPMMPEPVPVHGYPPAYPVQTCCGQCYEGRGGGPCYQGYGVPPPPEPSYEGYYGYGYGHERACHVSRCDYYLSEDNPQGCSIM